MATDAMGYQIKIPVSTNAPKFVVGTTTYAVDAVIFNDSWQTIQIGVLINKGDADGYRWIDNQPITTAMASAFPAIYNTAGGTMAKWVESIIAALKAAIAKIVVGTVVPPEVPIAQALADAQNAIRAALASLKITEVNGTLKLG